METPATESDFVMHGARAAVSGGMLHIEELVKAIELAVVQNTGLAFDLAKTLIESACKTILAERGGSFDKDDDLPKLFKMARQVVPFLPASLQELSKMKFSVSSTTSNGYRFADLGPANNPSGWAGMLKVKSPDGTTSDTSCSTPIHCRPLARQEQSSPLHSSGAQPSTTAWRAPPRPRSRFRIMIDINWERQSPSLEIRRRSHTEWPGSTSAGERNGAKITR